MDASISEVFMLRSVRYFSTVNEALNRLRSLQEYSLANYAAQASLYARVDRSKYLAAIEEIAKGRHMRATDIGRLLVDRRIHPERGGFLGNFTALNDLCAKYVAGRILEEQPALIDAIVECTRHLEGDPKAKALALRTLIAEQDNLRQLRRLLDETTREEANLRLAA
jgi:hypothetical protein